MERTCADCKTAFPLDRFYSWTPDPSKSGEVKKPRYSAYCKPCHNGRMNKARPPRKYPDRKPNPTEKFCPGCEQILPIDRFRVAYVYKGRSTLTSRCVPCTNLQIRAAERVRLSTKFSVSWFSKKYNSLKRNARKRGVLFTLTPEDFRQIRREECCTYCGITDAMFSIDRKDNSGPYTPENCVVACWRCNSIKSDNLTYAEMLVLGMALREIDEGRRARGETPLGHFHFTRRNAC